MSDYIRRLKDKGFSDRQAKSIYKNCMIENGIRGVEEYIRNLEENYVDKVSAESVWSKRRGLLRQGDF